MIPLLVDRIVISCSVVLILKELGTAFICAEFVILLLLLQFNTTIQPIACPRTKFAFLVTL